MIGLVVALPALAGLICFFLPWERARRILLVGAALAHSAVVVFLGISGIGETPQAWLSLDEPGFLFLAITSFLFLCASWYCVGYLRREERADRPDIEEGFLFRNSPEQVFIGALLLFLAAMSLVTVSRHLGLFWVAVEATTLASAPLIYFHRHHRSLEAMWKYLLVCSVGIAIALLGTFFLAASAAPLEVKENSLLFSWLLTSAPLLDPFWLKLGFIFLLVGYGTKMGLAPLHTWLPDAHSEAPSVVSALLSGALLNCAFLGIMRAFQICNAAGLGNFCREALVGFGLFSLAVAAVFLVNQRDYKRMLAYSSVEHMGILALGLGIGGAGIFGTLLHALNHALAKASLFLSAGNLLSAYKTKSVREVHGAVSVVPVSGTLWLAGFLAITGTPPFGLFVSKFIILKAILDSGKIWVVVLYLFFLAAVFITMASAFTGMAFGKKNPFVPEVKKPEPLLLTLSPMVLVAATLFLGLYLPPVLGNFLRQASLVFGGTP